MSATRASPSKQQKQARARATLLADANAAVDVGNYQAAATALSKVLETEPDNVPLLCMRSRCFTELSLHQLAVIDAQLACETLVKEGEEDPQPRSECMSTLAHALQRMGCYDEACRAYEHCTHLVPDNEQFAASLADCVAEADRVAEEERVVASQNSARRRKPRPRSNTRTTPQNSPRWHTRSASRRTSVGGGDVSYRSGEKSSRSLYLDDELSDDYEREGADVSVRERRKPRGSSRAKQQTKRLSERPSSHTRRHATVAVSKGRHREKERRKTVVKPIHVRNSKPTARPLAGGAERAANDPDAMKSPLGQPLQTTPRLGLHSFRQAVRVTVAPQVRGLRDISVIRDKDTESNELYLETLNAELADRPLGSGGASLTGARKR